MVVIWALSVAAIECARRGLIRAQAEGVVRAALGGRDRETASSSSDGPDAIRLLLQGVTRSRVLSMSAGIVSGMVGVQLFGPFGMTAGVLSGAVVLSSLERRRAAVRIHELERQLAEAAQSTAMAARSGLSIAQALDFAAEESTPPMSEVLGRFTQGRSLGIPFEEALRRLADDLDSPDARLFTLVVRIHARSGGNLAGALDDVAATIRHRIGVRRELRALSAQGRISGAILGALPIAFFLVLAATSHRELAPVYRSSAGIAMIFGGLLMEALAFVWIRRLLRIEA